MADGRLERFLRRFGDVRGREARTALAVTAYFFLITFAFYVIKPVKTSLLVDAPAWWPYADLATALLIGFVVALNARLLDRLPRRTYVTASLLFFIAGALAFWWIFDFYIKRQLQTPVADSSGIFFLIWAQSAIVTTWPIPLIVFCFWTDVFIAMSITQFWISVNDIFDPHQAKRLVGLFVTGGLVGGIVGSGVTALLPFLPFIDTEDILLAVPVVLVLAVITVNVVYAGQQKIDATAGEGRIIPSARVGYLESFKTVRRNRYLLLLAAMLASAMAAAALINYQFMTAIRSVYTEKAARTSFVALFFLIILVLSTVVHLATTGRFLKSYGIRWAISLAPVVLLVGTGVVFLIPAAIILVWAMAVRGFDKGFDNTLSQSVRELLYIPVPADVKYKAKIFIDMFINKFAAGLGAALYLVLYHVRHFDYRADQPLAIIREIGLAALVFLVLWLALTRLVYRQYPAVLKSDIRKIHKEGREAVTDHVDVDLTLKVFNTIQSRERSATLYYMNVFDLVRSKDLTPELRELLGIKRDELKARAMDSLVDVGGGTFFPGLEETMTDTAFQKEIDLIFLLPSYQKIMDERLGAIVSSTSELDRIEAAHSIARMAARPSTLDALARLLQDPSPEVALYALNSAAVHRRPEHLPLVVRLLANPATMAEAQAALAAYGPGSEASLAETLRADDAPLEIRRAIPEVLARIGTQKAADVLVAELARHRKGMEQAVIEALYRIRTDQPEVRFREKELRPELRRLIRSACAVVLEHAGPAPDLRAPLDIRLRRVFDLMTLMYPREDIVNDYQNIRQGTAKSVDYALEHLDNLLDREDKELLFPLLEDLPPEERVLRLKKALRLK